MQQIRRKTLLWSLAAGAVTAPLLATGAAAAGSDARHRITELIQALPGDKAAYLYTPDKSFVYEYEPEKRLVIASTFKVFVCVAALQLVDAGEASLDEMLPLDSSVYMLGSPAFTPKLHGEIPLRVAIQEMIAFSDNTATDMVIKRTGIERVRALIAKAGLGSVQIPDTTRELFAYAAGMPKGETGDYRMYFGIDPPPANLQPRSIANDVVTSKAAPRELATFYERAMNGEFFKKTETLADFRVAMSCGSGLADKAIPRGSLAYMKAGSFSHENYHGLANAGAMETLDRTVYFSMMMNFPDAAPDAFDRYERLFMETHKAVLTLVRALQFLKRYVQANAVQILPPGNRAAARVTEAVGMSKQMDAMFRAMPKR